MPGSLDWWAPWDTALLVISDLGQLKPKSACGEPSEGTLYFLFQR